MLDTTLAGDMDRDLSDDEEERAVSVWVLPINPIVEKDQEIADLIKTVGTLRDQLAAIPVLQKGLEEAKAENKRIMGISRQAGRRLSISRKANEQKMVGLIKHGTNWTEDSAYMACSHAAALCDDDFEFDEVSEDIKPKKKDLNS